MVTGKRISEFLSQEATGPEIILCSHPFLKCIFLEKLVRHARCGVLYLDFDMLYSGYTGAGIFKQPHNVLIRQPSLSDWRDELTSIIQMTSIRRHLIVIDSLNGMFTTFGHKDAMHLAFHSITLLASLGSDINTRVAVAAISRKTTNGWETPSGHVASIHTTYALEKGDDNSLTLVPIRNTEHA